MPLYLHDHKRPTLFLHIPKTGGTTIEGWLEDVYEHAPLYFSKEPNSGFESTPQHFGYQTLTELLGDNNTLHLFKFAIVRNPYHRLESEFFYRVKMRSINLGKNADKMFSAWVCDLVNKAKTRPYILDNHLRTQTYYYNNDVHIYKFEDGFNGIIDDIAKRLKVNAPKSLTPKKVGNKKAVIWSNEAIALVNEFYKEDFEHFAYPIMDEQASTVASKLKFTYFTLYYYLLTVARNIKHSLRKTPK